MKIMVRILTISTILLLLTIVTFVPQAIAKPQYRAALSVVYGNGSCVDCHIDPNGGKSLTDYGSKFMSQPDYGNNSVVALRTIGAPPAVPMSATTPVVTVITPIVTEDTSATITPVETISEVPIGTPQKKSPGIGIAVVIGIIGTIYIMRKRK